MLDSVIAKDGLISIHTLVKRATREYKTVIIKYFYFNPRPRKEGDSNKKEWITNPTISIHALVKRAT